LLEIDDLAIATRWVITTNASFTAFPSASSGRGGGAGGESGSGKTTTAQAVLACWLATDASSRNDPAERHRHCALAAEAARYHPRPVVSLIPQDPGSS